nr:zinc finger BED domain-containing protein 5-like [Pelodiscus sinensis]|eukprot:XP_025043297.1 zinc finger BED domain-containing protein 5-like [Pelodiscus sinensis]
MFVSQMSFEPGFLTSVRFCRQCKTCSYQTVTRRIHAISSDMQTQLKDDLEICDWFSLQFDESTDISDTVQLAVMVDKRANSHGKVKE